MSDAAVIRAGGRIALLAFALVGGCSEQVRQDGPQQLAASRIAYAAAKQRIESAVEKCDAARITVDDAQLLPATAAYVRASSAAELCGESRRLVRDEQFPDVGSAEEDLRAATSSCATSLFAQEQALKKIAEGADLGFRPSVIVDARRELATAEALLAKCRNGMAATAVAAGLESSGSPTLPAAPPAAVAEIVAEYNGADDACRGGFGNDPATARSCAARDKIEARLKSEGWCWTEDDEADGPPQGQWRRCNPSSPG